MEKMVREETEKVYIESIMKGTVCFAKNIGSPHPIGMGSMFNKRKMNWGM